MLIVSTAEHLERSNVRYAKDSKVADNSAYLPLQDEKHNSCEQKVVIKVHKGELVNWLFQ